MQVYDRYKDSGIEWLGEIPEHWETEKGKWMFQKNERPVLPEHDVITCFRDGQVTLRKNRREDGFTNSLKEIGYQGIAKGDLVIHQMDAFAGAIGVSDSDGKSTPVYSVCSPRLPKIDNYYYAYFLRNMALSGLILSLAKGIRERSTDFRFNDFANLFYPIPPLPEQQAIAAFLDEKCGKIDEALRIKQQQIEKLKELRQITIHNAVTKGINPNAEMKDSGIRFLEKIPKHWKLGKFKFFLTIKARLGWKGLKADEYVDLSDYGFLATPNIKNEKIAFENAYFITQHRYNESPEIMLEPLDVLLVKDGSTLGISNIIKYLPFKCTVNSSIAVLKALDQQTLNPFFLNYFLKGEFIQRIISNMKGGMGVPHLFQADIKNFVLIIPPLSEQEQIVTYLEEKTAKIDEAIIRKTEQIAKLNEYKQSLINEVVTGKVKVTD